MKPEEELQPVEGERAIDAAKESATDEFETQGEQLKTDKAELQKIIERNRQEVQERTEEMLESGEEPLPLKEQVVAAPEQQRREKIEATRELVEQFDKEKAAPATSKSKGDDKDEDHHVKLHAEAIYNLADPEQQIERIVQLALTKDPYFAVKVAKHLDNNYVLNEVHDRLIEDQVRDELIKRGVLDKLE